MSQDRVTNNGGQATSVAKALHKGERESHLGGGMKKPKMGGTSASDTSGYEGSHGGATGNMGKTFSGTSAKGSY